MLFKTSTVHILPPLDQPTSMFSPSYLSPLLSPLPTLQHPRGLMEKSKPTPGPRLVPLSPNPILSDQMNQKTTDRMMDGVQSLLTIGTILSLPLHANRPNDPPHPPTKTNPDPNVPSQ